MRIAPPLPIMAGCRKDVERLLCVFKGKETLQFRAFREAFDELEFHTIFMGRLNTADLLEFSEKLLQMAISYTAPFQPHHYNTYVLPNGEGVLSTDNINADSEMSVQERIFGVYLAYSLYFVQQDNCVAHIHVTPGQINDLERFIQERLVKERHMEAYAALYRLICSGAFQIRAFDEDYIPLKQRSYNQVNVVDNFVGTHHDGTKLFCTYTEGLDLSQAELISKTYHSLKQSLPSFDLNHVKTSVSDIHSTIVSSMGQPASASTQKSLSKWQNHLDQRRKEIKERAFEPRTEPGRRRRLRQRSSRWKSEASESLESGRSIAGSSRKLEHSRASNRKRQISPSINFADAQVEKSGGEEGCNKQLMGTVNKGVESLLNILNDNGTLSLDSDKEDSSTNSIHRNSAKARDVGDDSAGKAKKTRSRGTKKTLELLSSKRLRLNVALSEKNTVMIEMVKTPRELEAERMMKQMNFKGSEL